jgi:hypothetical protein
MANRLTDEAAEEIRKAVAIVHSDRMTKGIRSILADHTPKDPPGPKDPPEPKDPPTDPPPTDPKDPPTEKRRGIWSVGNEEAE